MFLYILEFGMLPRTEVLGLATNRSTLSTEIDIYIFAQKNWGQLTKLTAVKELEMLVAERRAYIYRND